VNLISTKSKQKNNAKIINKITNKIKWEWGSNASRGQNNKLLTKLEDKKWVGSDHVASKLGIESKTVHEMQTMLKMAIKRWQRIYQE